LTSQQAVLRAAVQCSSRGTRGGARALARLPGHVDLPLCARLPAPSQRPAGAIPWKLLLSKPAVWALIISHFCHNWGTFILLTWMPTYYNQARAGAIRENKANGKPAFFLLLLLSLFLSATCPTTCPLPFWIEWTTARKPRRQHSAAAWLAALPTPTRPACLPPPPPPHPLLQVLGLDLKSSGFFSVLPWVTMAIAANVGGWIADSMVERGVSVTIVRKVMQTVRNLGSAPLAGLAGWPEAPPRGLTGAQGPTQGPHRGPERALHRGRAAAECGHGAEYWAEPRWRSPERARPPAGLDPYP
jgi:hypothetical protein